LLIM